MEHFKLKAKKIQLISDIRNNADFVACLEEKNLVIKVDRASAKFSYKKIKCSSKDYTEIIVQSDGLKIIMNRHALFEERLEAAMNGVVLGGKLQQQGNKPANNSSSIETVAYPENRSAGNGNRIGKASHGAITSSSASSVTKRNLMSPGTGLVSSPLTTSLISQSLKRQDDGYIVTQRNSTDRAIRTETPSERTVNTVFNARTSKTEHGLPSNRGDLRENVVTSLKSASSPGWLDDECLDLSSNVPSDPQKHVVAPPILRVYSQKPNNAIQFLRGQTPDPTRKNLFAAYSISAQKTGSGNNNREVSPESSPYSRVYSTSSAAINTASRLGKLDLVVHSSKKQNTPSSPDSAWFTEEKEVVAGKGPVVVRPASNFFASFRQVHANSGSRSGNSSGISGSDSSSNGIAGSSNNNSKRIPGGIRNLGNSCYISSILQALLSMEYLHEVLLSPFWSTLLEQQQEQSQQQTAVPNNVVATPLSSTSSASTTLPADGSELDVLIVNDDEATDSAALACGIFSVEASSAEEVRAGGMTVPVQQGNVPASELSDALTEKNVLQKYQVHSVLTELRKLFQQKAALSNSNGVIVVGAAPGMVPAATVLDVTRLKRAMVHHTKKFAGYSQQDAQEFLSDLLDAVQSEMQDRFTSFAEFFAGTMSAPPLVLVGANDDANKSKSAQQTSFGTPAPSSYNSSSFPPTAGADMLAPSRVGSDGDGDGDNDVVVVGTKRTWLDAEALNQVTAKKMTRVGEFDATSDVVYSIPSTQEGSTVLKTPFLDSRAGDKITFCPPCVVAPCSELMQSTLRVDIQCLQCGHVRDAIHEKYQHFPLDLSLSQGEGYGPVGAEKAEARNLKELMGQFFADETRDLTCELCSAPADSGMNGTASIHSTIAELPPVLVLQLKRFEYDMQLQKMTKVCTDVDFPSSLDLSTFCCSPASSASNECVRNKEKSVLDDSVLWKGKKSIWDMSASALLRDPSAFTALCSKITTSSTCEEASSGGGSAMYDLTGVVRHIGRTEGAGHYVCDVKLSALERRKNSSSGIEGIEEWRRYDDSLVTALTQSSVMHERDTPYLFFYTKR